MCQAESYLLLFLILFLKVYNLNMMIKKVEKFKDRKYNNRIIFGNYVCGDFVENLYFNFPKKCEQRSHFLSDSLCLIEK